MADLESWEDDQAVQDERLSQQTQQMNLGRSQPQRQHPGAPFFQPGAQSFQPGAQSFQPGAQTFQPGVPYGQYGGYQYPGNQQYQWQQDQGAYQYNHGAVSGGQEQQNFYGQRQNIPAQPQPRPQQTLRIAKPGEDVSSITNGKDTSQAKDSTVKVEAAGKTKVLSIGTPSAKINESKQAPEAGNKAVAAKAIEKSESTPASSQNDSSGKTSPSPASGRNSPSREEKRAAAREADAVAKEQEADVDDETLESIYGKEHVNVIFLGHVDAGKSTLGGSILVLCGLVDQRTLEKYKADAKAAGRESWYLSWALDLTREERAKGKTIEVGRGFFETDKRRYSILDAPGHKTFVPNMIGGASQADVGILVISARKNEYEAGFEKGGQTREHAILAKTQGVNKLIVAVNKMDDPTVEWSHDRYKECTTKLAAFLKGIGYNPKTDLTFMPISAQTGLNLKDRLPKGTASWYDGPSLLEFLDNMTSLERKINAPLMMPIASKYRDMGVMIEGKIDSGVIKKGSSCLMMPNGETITVTAVYGETEEEIQVASCGDQVRIRLRGAEEEDILPGFVLCSPKRPVHCVTAFEAQIVLLELRSILSAGFSCVCHVHAAQEEVTFAALLHKLEKGTGRKSKKPPGFATKGMNIIARLEVTGGAGSLCVERFEDYPSLGRFTLRDQGQTIAIGKITKLLTDSPAT